MPSGSKLHGLTEEEKREHQRERNRRKQQAFRERKRAAKNFAVTGGVDAPVVPAVKREEEVGRDDWNEEGRRSVELAASLLPSSHPRSVANTTWDGPSPSSSCELAPSSSTARPARSGLSLFESLLNGGFLSPTPFNASQPKPSSLPSFTYPSPVNIGRYPSYNPLMAIDWKWRLLQAHTALYETRFDRRSGFIANLDVEKTTASAQVLILRLLAATSSQKAFFDAKRNLPPRCALVLDQIEDERILCLPDPLYRVVTATSVASGVLQLTERVGRGIETSQAFGDVMNPQSWDLGEADPFLLPMHKAGFPLVASPRPRSDHLRGSSVREIILGLESPGARADEEEASACDFFPPSTLSPAEEVDWWKKWVLGRPEW